MQAVTTEDVVKLGNTVFSDEIRENEDLNTMDVPLEGIGIDLVTIVNKPGYLKVKRIVDIIVSFCALVILLIPILVIALLIKMESPGPAIFKQQRMGKDGKPFVMYKFRTMRMDAPHERATRDFADADKYITSIGAVLRRTSLDELPQLLNVLLGSMSLVGYRPVCLTETELNDLRMRCGVFAMKPGITGLAQVSGRDELAIEEKVLFDAKYVRECSAKLDLWCLIKTVSVVVTGKGVM